jgi:hypothetical protein
MESRYWTWLLPHKYLQFSCSMNSSSIIPGNGWDRYCHNWVFKKVACSGCHFVKLQVNHRCKPKNNWYLFWYYTLYLYFNNTVLYQLTILVVRLCSIKQFPLDIHTLSDNAATTLHVIYSILLQFSVSSLVVCNSTYICIISPAEKTFRNFRCFPFPFSS